MDNKILHAMHCATEAHKEQRRRYTNEPYIVHPFAVAGLVTAIGGTSTMIQAAFLHDVVEDTDTDNADIETHFGVEVANLVWWVTNKSKPSDGNRAERRKIDRNHIAAAPAEAQTIKLADIIDNTRSIGALDSKFADTYMLEKFRMLKILTEGDKSLHAIAHSNVCSHLNKDATDRDGFWY